MVLLKNTPAMNTHMAMKKGSKVATKKKTENKDTVQRKVTKKTTVPRPKVANNTNVPKWQKLSEIDYYENRWLGAIGVGLEKKS